MKYWLLQNSILLHLPSIIATLAQLVEQLIRNEQVVGSSPISGSKSYSDLFKTPEINDFQAFFCQADELLCFDQSGYSGKILIINFIGKPLKHNSNNQNFRKHY